MTPVKNAIRDLAFVLIALLIAVFSHDGEGGAA